MDALHLETVAKSVIEKTMLRLPENIRCATEACAIEIAYIKECHTSGEALESDLLGLFEGRCHSDAESEHVDDLPRVRLFLDPLGAAGHGTEPGVHRLVQRGAVLQRRRHGHLPGPAA